jgi:hypothetical protein
VIVYEISKENDGRYELCLRVMYLVDEKRIDSGVPLERFRYRSLDAAIDGATCADGWIYPQPRIRRGLIWRVYCADHGIVSRQTNLDDARRALLTHEKTEHEQSLIPIKEAS